MSNGHRCRSKRNARAIATSLALICLESRRLSTGVVIVAFLLLTATVALFALSIPYAVDPSRRLLSLAQLYVALITNYGLFLGLSSLHSRTIPRLFLSVAGFMLIVATLEVYFGLRPFVDAVRSVIPGSITTLTSRSTRRRVTVIMV